MTMSARARWAILASALLVPALAQAQQGRVDRRRPVRRRQAAIEIRGQVPTPQVVTVRPREVPAYSRQVLVPNFYDHDFWPAILPGYELVPRRMLTGVVTGDTLGAAGPRPSGSGSPTRTTPGALAPDSARARPESMRVPRATPSPDSARHSPGTTPARNQR